MPSRRTESHSRRFLNFIPGPPSNADEKFATDNQRDSNGSRCFVEAGKFEQCLVHH